MKDQVSRFSLEPTGTLRMPWLALIYPKSWRERSCDHIADHERGVRFQLTLEEQSLMITLSECMEDKRLEAGVSVWKVSRFLTWPQVRAVRDRAYAAISDKRGGDDREWRRLAGMEAGELSNWIEQVWQRIEEPQGDEP